MKYVAKKAYARFFPGLSEDMAAEVAAAKAVGLDGFVCSWYGADTPRWDALQLGRR